MLTWDYTCIRTVHECMWVRKMATWSKRACFMLRICRLVQLLVVESVAYRMFIQSAREDLLGAVPYMSFPNTCTYSAHTCYTPQYCVPNVYQERIRGRVRG